MADYPAKHEFIDDYPYLAYASEVDTVAGSGGEGGGGSYTLPVASADTLGGVKIGSGLAIDNNGVLSNSGSDIFYVSVSGVAPGTGQPILAKNCTELNNAIEAGKKIVLQGTISVGEGSNVTTTSEMVEHYSYIENDVTNYGYVFPVYGSVMPFEGTGDNYPMPPR